MNGVNTISNLTVAASYFAAAKMCAFRQL